MRDVRRDSRSSDRDPRGRCLLEVLERQAYSLSRGGGHLRLDEAWSDRIDCDSELPELDREGLREALEARLRGGVVGLPAAAQGRRAGHVDDATPAGARHVFLGYASDKERPAQMDVHYRVPVLGGHLEEKVV